MDGWQVAAALASAALHAGWNAAVKAGGNPRDLMTAQMLVSGAIVLPGLLWTGLPPLASWPWIAGSTAMSVVTILALLRAYEASGFGIAYPVVRALSVLLVVPMAALVSGESLTAYGFAGVGLVACSLLMLALGRPGGAVFPRRTLGWIWLAGLATAAYVLCDAQGVRSAGAPWAYGFAVSIVNGLAMYWVQHGATGSWHAIVRQLPAALPIAAASTASYMLILWVLNGAPVAAAAALRDTSAVFALAIAIVWLKEPYGRLQLLAILLAALAVPLLRLS